MKVYAVPKDTNKTSFAQGFVILKPPIEPVGELWVKSQGWVVRATLREFGGETVKEDIELELQNTQRKLNERIQNIFNQFGWEI